MAVVMSSIKPWTAPDGSVRYYIDSVSRVLSDYRSAGHDSLAHHGFSFDDDRAGPLRVRECIEANIIPRTKVYIDSEGYVHIYGYAIVGKGAEMGLPATIEKAVLSMYGFCSEEEREARRKDIGFMGTHARVGDTVEITAGRKSVGRVFEVARITEYSYSQYRPSSVYLWDADGFKVQAHNCTLREVGYAR